MSPNRRRLMPSPARAPGFTLVELMVGLVLGLLVLAVAAVAFLNVSSSRREMEKTNRQMENGRYAMQLLMDDIALAGYWGTFDSTVIAAPVAIPDPCTTDPVTLKLQVPLHVQAYADTTAPTCLSDVKADTRIIVVRRAATCATGTGTGDCAAAAAGTAYIQSANCNTELHLPVAQRYVVSATLADFTLRRRDCATAAELRKYVVHIYFVANNNNPGDGISTLKRADLGAGVFSVQPVVEGIDSLQAEYAIDTDGNGTPDAYTADPATVSDLANVVGVQLYVLARNTESTGGYQDIKVYSLGPQSVGPLLDAYKRHAYSALVRVANAAGRRE